MLKLGNKPSIRVLAERWQVKPSQVEEWLVKWAIDKAKDAKSEELFRQARLAAERIAKGGK